VKVRHYPNHGSTYVEIVYDEYIRPVRLIKVNLLSPTRISEFVPYDV
jgi:hypothetical protein